MRLNCVFPLLLVLVFTPAFLASAQDKKGKSGLIELVLTGRLKLKTQPPANPEGEMPPAQPGQKNTSPPPFVLIDENFKEIELKVQPGKKGDGKINLVQFLDQKVKVVVQAIQKPDGISVQKIISIAKIEEVPPQL